MTIRSTSIAIFWPWPSHTYIRCSPHSILQQPSPVQLGTFLSITDILVIIAGADVYWLLAWVGFGWLTCTARHGVRSVWLLFLALLDEIWVGGKGEA
jgi:hypothetical protein